MGGTRKRTEWYRNGGIINVYAQKPTDQVNFNLLYTGRDTKEQMLKCRPGDIIRSSAGHSVVFIENRENGTQYLILDCNWNSNSSEGNCKVRVRNVNYGNLTVGISRAANSVESKKTSTGFVYKEENGNIIITGYTGSAETVVIPSTIDGKPVTNISYAAFRDNKTMTSVIIPDSVISIGLCAFERCTGLKSVTMGNYVSEMKNYAFKDTTNLETINLSESLRMIPEQAFFRSGITSITIPSSVGTIGNAAFGNCKSLRNITINADNLGSTGTQEFIDSEKCYDKSIFYNSGNENGFVVTFGEGVRSIPSYLFATGMSAGSNLYCRVSEVRLPGSIQSIGDYAFYNCHDLQKTVYNGSAEGWNNVDVSGNNEKLTSVIEFSRIDVTDISLNSSAIFLYEGYMRVLLVTVLPSNATDKRIMWTSSDTAIATVKDGAVTAVSPGVATITAKTVNGLTATCTVTVRARTVEVTGITVSPTTASIVEGNTYSLTAAVTPSNATDKTVTWTSSNTAIATVSNGTVTGKSAGTATITAKASNGMTATCTVTVRTRTVEVTGITVSQTTASIVEGNTYPLTATVTPGNATDKTVEWTSSNTAVATVTNGTVKGVSAGTATITAKTSNGLTATCKVTVKAKTVDVTKITVSPTTASIVEGNTYSLTAAVTPGNATDKTVTWTSSNKAVATVTNGTVKGVSAGTATITAKASNGMTATCKVTVTAKTVKVTGVALNKTSLNVVKGKTATLKATVSPSDAANKAVTWKSSNTGVLTVSSSGKITAKTPGKATVTVTTADGSYTAKCTVRVQFTDVTDTGEFFYTPVYNLVDKKVIEGWSDGTFRPYNVCNRASVVTFLWRMKGKPSGGTAKFKDLTGNSDFDKAIAWASQKGIAEGYSDNTFRPWVTCNRTAVITFIWRAAGKPMPTRMSNFKDVTNNMEFDLAISWASEKGITTGYSDNTFRPWDTCTRAAIVSFLYRARNYIQ